MKDITLFAKTEKELETLIKTIRIYIQELGLEVGLEKCVMLIAKSGKRQIAVGIVLQNQKRIRYMAKTKITRMKTLRENENYKYLGILNAITFKEAEMKEKVSKDCRRRTRNLLDFKLCSRNFIKGVNTWIVLLGAF